MGDQTSTNDCQNVGTPQVNTLTEVLILQILFIISWTQFFLFPKNVLSTDIFQPKDWQLCDFIIFNKINHAKGQQDWKFFKVKLYSEK